MVHSLRSCLVFAACAGLLAGCPTGSQDDDDVASCNSDQRPTLTIVSPDTGDYFDSDDMISWALTVTDPDTDLADLTITLQDVSNSTPDELGVNVPLPNGNGQTTFTMAADLLEDGQAVVRVFVEDPDGCSTNDQILVCVNELIAPCE